MIWMVYISNTNVDVDSWTRECRDGCPFAEHVAIEFLVILVPFHWIEFRISGRAEGAVQFDIASNQRYIGHLESRHSKTANWTHQSRERCCQ